MNSNIAEEQTGKQISINELLYQINAFNEWRDITEYQIIEHSQRYGIRKYKIYNLRMVLEDNIIFGSDIIGTLISNDTYLLNMFTTSFIKNIYASWLENNNTYQATINFYNGSINIKALIV